MSDYEVSDQDKGEEETTEGWLEYWFLCGGVSKAAQQAIESVDGKVLRMTTHPHYPMVPPVYAVCLLYYPGDDDQGYCYHTDDGENARKLFIASADDHHDLYIYCEDGSTPQFESDTTQLRIVTEEEYFRIADEREAKS